MAKQGQYSEAQLQRMLDAARKGGDAAPAKPKGKPGRKPKPAPAPVAAKGKPGRKPKPAPAAAYAAAPSAKASAPAAWKLEDFKQVTYWALGLPVAGVKLGDFHVSFQDSEVRNAYLHRKADGSMKNPAKSVWADAEADSAEADTPPAFVPTAEDIEDAARVLSSTVSGSATDDEEAEIRRLYQEEHGESLS